MVEAPWRKEQEDADDLGFAEMRFKLLLVRHDLMRKQEGLTMTNCSEATSTFTLIAKSLE